MTNDQIQPFLRCVAVIKNVLSSIVIATGLSLAVDSVSYAQAPAYSRGIQILSIGYEECMRRAKQALESEGYRIDNQGGEKGDYHYVGTKGIHTSIIACNGTSDGKFWANVFVSSNIADGNLPGAERVKLQERMD